jgi:hypothetical protein
VPLAMYCVVVASSVARVVLASTVVYCSCSEYRSSIVVVIAVVFCRQLCAVLCYV